MRKLILAVLGILMMGVLVGCTEDTTVEDYQVLEGEFYALSEEQEITLTEEVRFELLGVENGVLYISSTITQTDGADAMKSIVRDQRGTTISEMEMILTNDSGYMDVDTMMSLIMYGMLSDELVQETLEILEIHPEDLTPEEILRGSYTHLQLSQEMLQEMEEEGRDSWTGIYGVFSEERLEEKLSVIQEDTFRIEITGESVGDIIEVYIEAVLKEMNLDEIDLLLFSMMEVAEMDENLKIDLKDDFLGWVRGGNLEDSTIIIERRRGGEDVYYQNIQLYVPERISITTDGRIVIGESDPITVPDLYLPADELEERLEEWLVDLIEEVILLRLDNEFYEEFYHEDNALEEEVDSGLVGLWSYVDFPEEQILFSEDGTGMFIIDFDDWYKDMGDRSPEFTWERRESGIITITFHGETMDIDYEIIGETLIFYESGSEYAVFFRVN